ncbi:MAG: AAA family ATPase, partial [Chloroflexi bacterium]|nr:AAA family ATPase [Chloroflexota bacterium]
AALSPAVAEQERLEKALEEAKRRCLAYEQAAKQLAEWEAQAASAQEEAERLAQEAAQAAALAQKIATLQDQARAKREEASQAASRMAVLAEERTRVEKQSEALSEAEEARCPVCESELTPERRDALLLRNAERLKELEQQEAQAHRARREAERAAQEAEAEVARLQKERERLAGEAESERARQRFTDLKARCAQARREREILADAPRVRDALLEQLQALGDPRQKAYLYEAQLRDRPRVEEEIARLEGTLRDLATRLEALEGELAAYGRLDEEMDALRAKRDQHRAGHERYLTHVHTASLLEARRATLEKHQKECEAAQKAVEALAAQVAEAQAAYDAEAHHAARERVLALHKEVSRLATERSEKETLQKNVQQEIQALYARREELVRQQKERARLEELRQTLSWARGLLRTAGPYITRQLVRRISHEASTLYGDIMGDYSGHLEWSEDYELSLEVRGNRRTFRQLSGGEQMCAALAVRLALLREMSHIDIAFFDEPTTNLDADRREGLAERIMQVRGFSQLFVISHDDTFERAAQNFIRIVKDASGSHVEMV